MRTVALLALLPRARAKGPAAFAARGMNTLSCPFGGGSSGSNSPLLVLQCNRLSPMADASVLASYGATSGAKLSLSLSAIGIQRQSL